MSRLDSENIFRILSNCGDWFIPCGEESSFRGLFNILDYVAYYGSSKASLLSRIFSMRLEDECRDVFKDLLDKVVAKVGSDAVLHYISREVNSFLSQARKTLKDVSESRYHIILDEYGGYGDTGAYKHLQRNIKSIYKDLRFLYMPGLGYVLNTIYLLPMAIEYLEEVRDVLSMVKGRFILMDEYDVMLFRKVLRFSGKVSSLSSFLVELLDTDQVYLEKTVEFDIGILRPCNTYLEIDLKNYLYILDGMPNIHYHLSNRCVSSGYKPYMESLANTLDIRDLLDLFEEKSLNIILTIDPYFYTVLSESAKGSIFVTGLLPNLVTRVMSKI